jgi:hypothetical protein
MDHMIDNCDMHYRLWKYWHSAMLHAKSMTIVTAYDTYKERAEGNLDPSWKVPIEDFHTFHERLSEQMLQYDPHHCFYPGDDNLRDCTQQNKKARQKSVKSGKGLAVEPVEKRGRGRPKKKRGTYTSAAGVRTGGCCNTGTSEGKQRRHRRKVVWKS